MGKGTRAVAGKQKASVIELFVDKKAVTLSRRWIWPKKSSDGSKKSAFFLSTWNFYLRERMFVKVTLRDAKEDVDEVCIEVQKTSDNAGGKPDFCQKISS